MTRSPQSFHKSSAEMVFFFLSLATNALHISLFDNWAEELILYELYSLFLAHYGIYFKTKQLFKTFHYRTNCIERVKVVHM